MNSGPNILWIVSDHQLHATRPPGFTGFPLQRKLARLGTEFTRAYSVLPICSPARASMLTGLFPHAHGLTENDGRFGGRSGLDSRDWMIHHPLRDAGYRCGWFGKWHVDNRHSALNYGFEGFSLPGYGYPYACGAYRDYLQRKGLPRPVARIAIRNELAFAQGTALDVIENRDWFDCVSGVAALEGPESLHEAYFVSEQAALWLDSLGSERFFVRVDPWGPHPPYLLPAPFFGMLDEHDIGLPANFYSKLEHRPDHHRAYRDYWRTALGLDEETWRRLYQHALEHVILVESALCKLLDHIDLDNTVVIFNSDHGDAVGSNGGIANKGDLMVEATMQIPLLMAGRRIPAGKVCDQLVGNLDIAPTLLDLCGIDIGRPLHGMSLVPLLNAGVGCWRSGQMSQHYGLQNPVVQRAWYRDHYKLVIRQDGFRELYDLACDSGELVNLAFESEYHAEMESMEQELIQAMRAVNDGERIVPALNSRDGWS